MKLTLSNITRTLLWTIIGGSIMIGVVYAGSTLDGWRTTGIAMNITAPDSTCRVVSAPADRFIPTRSWTEFNAVSANGPAQGIAIAACGAGYTYYGLSGGQSACNPATWQGSFGWFFAEVYFTCVRNLNGVFDGYDAWPWPNCPGLSAKQGHCFKWCNGDFTGNWFSQDGTDCIHNG